MSCAMVMFKSGSEKTYFMFHPRGPNLSRSRRWAWKKQSPKSSFLNSRGRLDDSRNSSVMV